MPPAETTATRPRERLKAVELAVGQIEKQFGKGSIMRLGQKGAIQPIDAPSRPAPSASTTPSASAACRAAASSRSSGRSRRARRRWRCRSLPRRRSSAAWRRSSTPSTRSTRPTRRSSASIVDNLLVSQPDNGEQALEIVEVLIRSGGVDVVVVDSVAALVPKAEIEGEMGEAQMGLQARLMSQALRKLTGVVSKSKTCLIFINQLREKIGVMFGNPETTTGGRALKFYASVRMDIRRIASDQGRRRGRRRPDARQGGEEQGGAAVPRGRVRHHVRRGHLARGRSARPRRRASGSSRRAAPGSPTAASGSARAARTPSSS